MPKELEESLRKGAKKKGLKGERMNAYIYGSAAMQKYLKGKKKNVS